MSEWSVREVERSFLLKDEGLFRNMEWASFQKW
jgi:hypothetical protein